MANIEELVICLRWVDENLYSHEKLIGLQPLKGTSADDVFSIIKDVLLRLGLKGCEAGGQCYDGGCKSGVTARFKEINPKMLLIHCFGYGLNLAAVKQMKGTLKNKFVS